MTPLAFWEKIGADLDNNHANFSRDLTQNLFQEHSHVFIFCINLQEGYFKKKKRVFRISEVQCKLEIRIFQGLPLKVVVVKKKSESDF